MFRFVYIIVLFICKSNVKGQVPEDCAVGLKSGVCIPINTCPSALEDLITKRMQPVICGFDKTIPRVCCVGNTPVSTTQATVSTQATVVPTQPVQRVEDQTTTPRPAAATTSSTTNITTTEYMPEYNDYVELAPEADCAPIPANLTSPKTGQKAWDKCVEYQEQVIYPCERSVALTGGRVRGNNCRHNANQLVINGVDANEAEFPHMALLGYGDEKSISFLCGGSIISDSFILTAGHCTFAKDFGPVSWALVGTLRRSDQYDRANLYGVRKIHKHPDYLPPRKYNDLALLETDRRIKLNLFVVPACLDVRSQPVEAGIATGWGATANGSNADVLQKVKLFKFSAAECGAAFPPNRHLKQGYDDQTQLCYGDKDEPKDTCQGDSGGPIQIKSGPLHCMYVITGVTSFGRRCGVAGQPAIYTRVAQFVPWIEGVVWR